MKISNECLAVYGKTEKQQGDFSFVVRHKGDPIRHKRELAIKY